MESRQKQKLVLISKCMHIHFDYVAIYQTIQFTKSSIVMLVYKYVKSNDIVI